MNSSIYFSLTTLATLLSIAAFKRDKFVFYSAIFFIKPCGEPLLSSVDKQGVNLWITLAVDN